MADFGHRHGAAVLATALAALSRVHRRRVAAERDISELSPEPSTEDRGSPPPHHE